MQNWEDELDVAVIAAVLLSQTRRTSPDRMFKERNNEGAITVLINRHLIDDESKFQQYFRLTKSIFHEVLEEVKGDLDGIPTHWIQKPIPAYDKLCITLRYLATGESHRSLAFQFRMHRTTISRIIKKSLSSIVSNLLRKVIPEPTSESMKLAVNDYFLRWNYPNCCGAIDGKHVRIRAPSNAGSAFHNYKEFHSIVLLAIVDANLKFVAVDVGSYGREGDAGIFAKSDMGKKIASEQFNIPPATNIPYTEINQPNVILGDEAFALHQNLMKPYPRQQSLHDHSKAIYNYRHSRGRRTTENTFGVLCSYFRIFFTPIQSKIETIDNIVLGSCILYNLLRTSKVNAPLETQFGVIDDIVMPRHNLIRLAPVSGRSNTEGILVREKFKEYFNGVGAVAWQSNMINPN